MKSHLNEEIHANQDLKEIVDDQQPFHQKWFAVLHETRSGIVDEVEVQGDDCQAGHGRSYQRPIICSFILNKIWIFFEFYDLAEEYFIRLCVNEIIGLEVINYWDFNLIFLNFAAKLIF